VCKFVTFAKYSAQMYACKNYYVTKTKQNCSFDC